MSRHWSVGIHASPRAIHFARLAVWSLMICLYVSGCDIHHYPHFQGRALAPGDKDYPIPNPHPLHILQFSATIPPTISPRFYVRYSVSYRTLLNKDGSLLRYESPPGCRWRQTDEFYVELPLRLDKQGDRYQGDVALDRFQPGKCGWNFSEILSPVSRTPLAWYRDYHSGQGNQADRQLDIWCTRKSNIHPYVDPARRNDLNELNNCADLTLVSGLFINLPPGFFASVPVDERSDGQPGIIARDTQSLTVRFHDLDELVRTYPKTP